MSTTGQSLLSNAHARLLHAGSQLPSPSDENIMAEQSLLPVLDKSNTSHLVSKSYCQANPVSMNSVSSSKNPGLNEIGTGLPKGPAGVTQVATGSDRASGRALLGSILLQKVEHLSILKDEIKEFKRMREDDPNKRYDWLHGKIEEKTRVLA